MTHYRDVPDDFVSVCEQQEREIVVLRRAVEHGERLSDAARSETDTLRVRAKIMFWAYSLMVVAAVMKWMFTHPTLTASDVAYLLITALSLGAAGYGAYRRP